MNIPYLERYFNVFAFDLTGFGEGKKMEYPFSLDDYVLEVKERLKKEGIKRPHVIAHSFGARIAVKIASENKNFFDKILTEQKRFMNNRVYTSQGGTENKYEKQKR